MMGSQRRNGTTWMLPFLTSHRGFARLLSNKFPCRCSPTCNGRTALDCSNGYEPSGSRDCLSCRYIKQPGWVCTCENSLMPWRIPGASKCRNWVRLRVIFLLTLALSKSTMRLMANCSSWASLVLAKQRYPWRTLLGDIGAAGKSGTSCLSARKPLKPGHAANDVESSSRSDRLEMRLFLPNLSGTAQAHGTNPWRKRPPDPSSFGRHLGKFPGLFPANAVVSRRNTARADECAQSGWMGYRAIEMGTPDRQGSGMSS